MEGLQSGDPPSNSIDGCKATSCTSPHILLAPQLHATSRLLWFWITRNTQSDRINKKGHLELLERYPAAVDCLNNEDTRAVAKLMKWQDLHVVLADNAIAWVHHMVQLVRAHAVGRIGSCKYHYE